MYYLFTLKALHLIAMVTWFAGLFYLPRLFVYHAMATEKTVKNTLQIMERKLLIMMHIGAITTLIFGILLLHASDFIYLKQGWMHLKLTLLVLMIVYHHICMIYAKQLACDHNLKSHVFFRWFNEIPVIFLIGIVVLAVFKTSLI